MTDGVKRKGSGEEQAAGEGENREEKKRTTHPPSADIEPSWT